MTAFLQRTWKGAYINAASIRSFGEPQKPAPSGFRRQTVAMTDGERIEVDADWVTQFMKQPVQLMPAIDVEMVSLRFDDSGTPEAVFTPMIAWALCVDGQVRPVTPAGVDDGRDEPRDGWFVQRRDGDIYQIGFSLDRPRFADVGDLIEHFTSQEVVAQPQPEAEA